MDSSTSSTNRSSLDYGLEVSPSQDASPSDAMISQPEYTPKQEKHSTLVNSSFAVAADVEEIYSNEPNNPPQRNKRKSPHSGLEADDSQDSHGIGKRLKLTAGKTTWSSLPSFLWQHILTFLHPRDLGRLMQTAKFFNKLLESDSPGVPQTSSDTQPLTPDAIWQSSRRLFCPRMPAPLQHRSELDMWRICCSGLCQCCGVAKANPQWQDETDPRHAGPGTDGLAAVFAFGTTCCGPCLMKSAVKELDLLLSPTTPSPLIPALPFVFVTNELHVIPPNVLSSFADTGSPQTTKVFWGPAIDDAKAELRLAQSLGSAAVEEWLKGLEARGKNSRTDAFRWEKWAATGGMAEIRNSAQFNLTAVSKHDLTPQDGPRTATTADTLCQSKPANVRCVDSQCRPEKTREEAAALKALRRAEIERRAMLIDPPLPPNVLVHVPSFQAAIQITAPLDDDAWELLRPRLLAQRADAEEKENEILAKGQTTVAAVSATVPKEVTDKDWDDIQGPVRARMARYADEMIRNTWGKGRRVNKENSPRFAAEVLLSVRARFYADVAEDAAAALSAGLQPQVDPPEGPFTQKLTLENMKWVFDMKIKAHTESYRKELFLCNGCDSNRYYGFEGVIQHYAAKHTKALSVGNVVVHWRAEWPEEPPFNPNPRGSKNPRHGLSLQQHSRSSVSVHQDKNAFSSNGNVPHSLPSHSYPAGPALPPTYSFRHFDPYRQPPAHVADGCFPPAPYPPGYGTTGGPQPPPAITSYAQYYCGAPEYPPTIMSPSLPVPNQHSGIGSHGQARPPYSAPQNIPYPHPYHAQLDDLAQNAKSVWNSLSSVKDLPGALKVYVTIHQVLKRFQSKYSEIPSLRMFNDGLSNHKEMRPVRNINGLLCRACTLGLGNAPFISHDRKSFSLPQLVNHFENRHVNTPSVASQSQLSLDWTQDMVLLPEMHELFALQTSLGTRGHQFNLIYEAVPWAFNLTKPAVSSNPQFSASGYSHDSSSRQFEDIRPSGATSPAGRHFLQPSWSNSNYAPETAATHQANYYHSRIEAVGCDSRPPAPHSPNWENGTARHSVSGRYGPHAEMNGRHHRDLSSEHRPYSSPGLADKGRNIVRGQTRAPEVHPTGSPIEPDRRYGVERGTRYLQPDQAESVGPRSVPRQDSAIPQERLFGSEGSVTAAGHSKVIRANEPDDFSLTAALESHLAEERDEPLRQQKSHTFHPERHRAVRNLEHGRRPVAQDDRYQEMEHYDGSQARGLVEGRYGHHETGDLFRGRYLPDSYEATDPQRRAGPNFAAGLPDRREAEYLHIDENRPLPLRYGEAYGETYEIVHVRDAEGEYVIRRPILRGREPSRMLHDDHYTAYAERITYLPPRPNPVYEPPVHEGRLVVRTPLTRRREQSAMPPQAAVDTSSHEEYDPRNPAPVAPPSIGQDYGH